MATEEVIVYDYETIKFLASQFNAELDQDTINNLLEIKKNNRFIRRKSPLRLKYKISTANAWRNERENSENVSENDKLTNSMISNLNKLSEQNYILIHEEVSKLYLSIKDDDEKKVIEDLEAKIKEYEKEIKVIDEKIVKEEDKLTKVKKLY